MLASAAILSDRFVSASSAADASDSLQVMLDSEELSEIFLSSGNSNEGLEALLQVLEGKLNDFSFEEGPALACRVYLKLYKLYPREASKILLKEPLPPGRLVQALLDVVTPARDSSTTSYTRVLALQVLEQICKVSPSTAQQQLLEAPNGLHRLAELLDAQEDEQVRNEALLVGLKIAEWPSCAKVWVFCEVCDVSLRLALAEGGLTGGNVVVRDCLELCRSLLKHDPASSADLVLSSSAGSLLQNLSALLDLRGGTEFRNPKPATVQPKDDLDEILKGGDTASSSNEATPRLTENEEKVLEQVFEILSLLLSTPEHQRMVWKQQPALASLVWELALVSPPPPTMKYPCAMPSAALQQKALQLTAERFHHEEIMERHNGMDRLLYLVCTGGGATAVKWDEKLALSQSALHVLRQTLDSDMVNLLVGHTLAPPNENEPPNAVQKLINTVAENLEGPPEEGNAMLERRRINLLGALGALGLFLVIAGDTTREMLLRITAPLNLLDSIFMSLEQQDAIVAMALLRFLSEWIENTPPVVKALLLSTYSTSLGVLFQKNNDDQKEVSTLAGLVLGLAMDGIASADSDASSTEEYGGWTKSGILTMISNRKGGISGYTAALESLKKKDASLPWSACKLESQVFQTWYKSQVHTVRKCVVQELTAGGDASEDDDDDDVPDASGASVKSLRRLMSQQSAELLELQQSLATAQATIGTQQEQLDTWKRRVESNPTELDQMLTEVTSKNQELVKTLASLREERAKEEQERERQLKEKDQQMDAAQRELADWKSRELEVREERDTLRGEMEALSSAYNTLEAEYNRRVGTASTATAAPTEESADGHHTIPGEQPEGEVSQQQTSSTATREDEVVASLRDENSRLRSEAVAADEWMTMAVQRMNDIGGQNMSLQQEVATLKQQLGASSTSTTVDNSGREVQQDGRFRELEQELASARGDIASTRSSLGKMTSEHNELLQKLDTLQKDLENSRVENLSLRENLRIETDKQLSHSQTESSEIEQVRAKRDAIAASKKEEVALLQKEIEALQQSLISETNNEELTSLRESVKKFQTEVDTVRKQLADTLKREGEEIKWRDATVLDLEQRLAKTRKVDEVASRSEEELKERDEEISKLKAANEAAQEWMAKAVEHHQVLSDQLSALDQDKAALTKEIQELRDTVLSTESKLQAVQNNKVFEEKDAADRSLVVDEVTQLRHQLQAAQLESASLQEKVAGYEQKFREINVASETSNDTAANMIKLQTAVVEGVRERDELKFELQSIRSELEKKQRQLHDHDAAAANEKTQTENDIRRLRAELLDSSKCVEAIRTELAESREAQADVSVIQNQLFVASEESNRLRTELETARAESSALKERASDLDRAYNVLLDAKNQLSEVAKEDKAALGQLDNEIKSLQTENASLKKNLDEFKSWTDVAQQRIAELQAEKSGELAELRSELDTQKSQLDEAVSEKKGLIAEKDQLNAEIEKLQTDVAQQRIAELQAEKSVAGELAELRSELDTQKSQLDEAVSEKKGLIAEKDQLNAEIEKLQTENGNWNGKYKSLEQDLKVVVGQLADFEVKANADFTAQLNEKEVALVEAEESLNLLRRELEEVQNQSEDVVRQWKERAGELESSVQELESELENQQQEAINAVSQWEERCSVLEQECGSLRDRTGEYESTVKELEKTIENQQQEATDAVAQWELRCSELEEKCVQFEADLGSTPRKEQANKCDELEIQLRDKEDALAEAEESLVVLKKELDDVHVQSEDVVRQWKDRAAELESILNDREQELEQQQREAANAVSQWETLCSGLQEKCEQLESDVEVSSTERLSLSKNLNQAQSTVEEKQNLLISLQTELEETRNRIILLQQEVDSKDSLLAVSSEQVKQERASLQTQLDSQTKALALAEEDLETLNKELTEMREQSEDVVNQWKVRTEELESTVVELEEQLEHQQAEATGAISQWEMRCSTLEEKMMQLENDLEESSNAVVRSLRTALEEKEALIASSALELENERESRIKEREGHRREKESDTSLISSLQSELHEEKKSAATSFEEVSALRTKWENDRKSLQKEIYQLRDEGAELRSQLQSERTTNDSEPLAELQAALTGKAKAEEALEVERLRGDENESRWNRDRGAYDKEIISLKTLVGELQEELRETNDTLQSYVTDEVSERATEIATIALREQIEEMRSDLDADRITFADEKRARLAAESEVEQLKSDLAVLLDDEEGPGDHSQRLAFKASDQVRRKERQEIEELRKALERALQELTSSREKEKDAEERAASSRMQVSVCEQEIIAAKSDLSFLARTMEELREAKASEEASLEHRIGTLEDDRKSLGRFHADELDSLRDEVTHAIVERDSARQLLNESEKRLESFTNPSSIEQDVDHDENPESELTKLRIEKAQLLAAAVAEGTRTERRIREEVALQTSLVEADVVQERELRVAAESALESARVELDELRTLGNESNSAGAYYSTSVAEETGGKVEKLTIELSTMTEETERLKEENTILRIQLEKSVADAKASVSELTEQCRKTQAKAHKLEREGHFDAEVNVEIARLRAGFSSSGQNTKPDAWVVVSDKEERSPTKDSLSATEAYDYIQKQKEAIKEERIMYSELLTEHYDLLALLAQQDLEKAKLLTALETAAGQDAVDLAIREAEESAVKQFGQFVRLT